MKRKAGFYIRSAIPALAVMATVFMLPTGAVFLKAFSGGNRMGPVLSDPYTWRILGFTILESSLSALISVVIALPFALFFSRYTFFGRRAILTVSDAAFAVPAILAVLGFVIYYGNNGILNSFLSAVSGGTFRIQVLYSFKAIILAHVYLNFPVAFSLITNALVSMPDQEETASNLLGASEIRTLFRVTLPKITGTVTATFTLIFLFCFPSFLIVMSLGGNPRYFTMEAEIYKRTYTDVNPASSAALSVFSFAVMTVLLLITGYGSREKRAQRKKNRPKRVKGNSRTAAVILSVLIILFMAPPMLSILYRAFFNKDGTFSLRAWTDIVRRSSSGAGTSISAVVNSLLIAFAASFTAVRMACVVAMGSARGKTSLISILTSLPMAVGSVSPSRT